MIDFAFTMMRVKGCIKWKYLGDGDGESRSTLKLKHWDGNSEEFVNTLELGHFVGTPGELKTLQFDFKYSKNNALWGPGEQGGVDVSLQLVFFMDPCFLTLYLFARVITLSYKRVNLAQVTFCF